MTHCLLFDSDGTLVDSEAINTEALTDELRLQGIDEDKSALLARYRGWQFKALLCDLGKLHHQELDAAFEERFRARASSYFDERLEPIPNIHNALQQLHQVKCVASNAPMSKLRQVLGKTGLSGFFNNKLFSAYEISRFKPDPALFLYAAEQMAFDADKCIVIEDSDAGVMAAVKAGMKCVHYVPHHQHPLTDQGSLNNQVGEFSAHSSVLGISDMQQLPDAISELSMRR